MQYKSQNKIHTRHFYHIVTGNTQGDSLHFAAAAYRLNHLSEFRSSHHTVNHKNVTFYF